MLNQNKCSKKLLKLYGEMVRTINNYENNIYKNFERGCPKK
jgi:hypothetical protein